MSETNKTYRIKANVGGDFAENFIALDTNLVQDYDTLDVLSIKIKSADTYRLHNSNYGVIVGRVLANNGFGIPNAKISVFIKSNSEDGELVKELYPFSTTYAKDNNGVRYNLLPDEKVNDCHQVVGTFPNKRYMLDNDVVLEVFDKYYKYTTRTNNSGDYIIMGVPVGNQTLHMDLDLSDCGILSQRPRDFVYKGYTMEQFENPSLFKEGTNYPELSQIFTQDRIVNVIPFWGNESLGESIGITRADIDVAFKFEPTCVFIGSVISDNASNGITKKCMATENMGNMEDLTTGVGTIEMIRKTPTGSIESFAVQGNQLINGDGVWCYQIPMNLDYMMTDEYGNMVPTNDPEKGIPTRTSVRFRISMQDNEENLDFYYRSKVLVPHNPQYNENGVKEDYDYEFGSKTKEESFRDLFWNNVYTVKSYIPRFQKKKVLGWKDKKFTGIKACNFNGNNNPMPYNNIRIKLPFMFTVMCAIIKCLMAIVMIFNAVLYMIGLIAAYMGNIKILGLRPFKRMYELSESISLNVLSEGLCPDLENWFFAPVAVFKQLKTHKDYDILEQTMSKVAGDNGFYDSKSIDYNNKESEDDVICITTKRDYLIACIEMNLAMEYRVINFDFYNDWINGTIYVPRFMRYVKPKKTAGKNGRIVKVKIKGCMDDTSVFAKSRRYTQQCSIGYGENVIGSKYTIYTNTKNPLEKNSNLSTIRKANNLHKKRGFSQFIIFEKQGGICHEHTTSKKQHVYYMKPCEWHGSSKVILYATDIVLLGSLKDCDENGLPQAFKYLSSTSYVMPTNLALTNMETNGPLYANGKNTVCAGTSNQTMTHNTDYDKGVHPINPDEGIVSELNSYAKSNDSNMDTQFEGEEFSDVVPITEAAGIAWNYTGPGQGGEDEKLFYNPGGHFLGLSCANSQTNLKSCINLTRICEVGATMSQRKEDVIDVNSDGDMEYIYTAPTGFISGNEINGEDFRAMFATMNQKRLKATKINNENEYYYYDFDFVKPLNFNGSFKSIINVANNKYNANVNVVINSDEELKKFGISKGLGYDFDPREDLKTQTRTIEDASIDYYRFRFGLSYEDILTINKNKIRHKSHFLYSEDGLKFLPQYENSYYFYFGLKAGASAIDEFNKQFFAKCDTSVVGKKNPSLTANIDDIKISGQTGDVSLVVDNVEMPLMSVVYARQIEGGEWDINDITDEWRQYYVINLNDIPFGNYIAEVIDFNGNRIQTNFSVGLDIFKYAITTFDFNVSDAMVYSDITDDERNRKHVFTGGYVQIDGVDMNDSYVSDISSALTFIVTNSVLSASTEFASTTYGVENNSENPPKVDICVKSAYTNYNLYLKYNIMSGDTVIELPQERALYLETFQVRDGSKINLAMGWNELPFYTIITPSGNSKTITPVETAYTIDNNEYIDYIEEIDDIDLNFGNNQKDSWWSEKNIYNDANGTTVGNWLKRISFIKNTDSLKIFSNNVFALNGTKILWGNAQNSNGIQNEIFNSTESIEAGYSLDDEASYFSTEQPYSAIAVNDDNLVSGNFFAYKSGGTIIYSDNILKGYEPFENTGYVYKSLPDGKLSYYTFTDVLEKPDESNYGVYYASFSYPVIEKPFDVIPYFYIWNDIEVYMPENVDNIAEVRYRELAGRTELNLYNGNLYNNAYGISNENGKTISGVTISNIRLDDFNKSVSDTIKNGFVSNLYLWGMDVEVKNTDRDGNSSIDIKPAYIAENDIKYATGVEDIKNAMCSISEGYPAGNDVYPSLVKKYDLKQDYTDYFPHNIKYEYFTGRGFDINCYDKNGNRSIGNGKICYNTNSGNTLFYNSIGTNADYVYLNTGTKLLPCYHILCKYVESKNNNHTSLPGGLCFLTITYLTTKKLQASFEYKDKSGYTQTKAFVAEGPHVIKKRFSIKEILSLNNIKYEDYIEPIVNKRLKCDDESWRDYIDDDNTNYLLWLEASGSSLSAIESSITINNYYYVEEYDNIKKIYPILLKDNVVNDNITLNTYYVNTTYTGGTYSGLVLTYKIYENSGDTRDFLEAKDGNEALGKLQYLYNGNSSSLSGITSDNKVKGSFFEIYVTSSSCTSGSIETDVVYWEVTYNLTVDIESASTEEKDEYIKDSIHFFISEKDKGARLDIERLADGNYIPMLYTNSSYKKQVNSLKTEFGENIPGDIMNFFSKNFKGFDEVLYVDLERKSTSMFYSKTLSYNIFESLSCEKDSLSSDIDIEITRNNYKYFTESNHIKKYLLNNLYFTVTSSSEVKYYLLELIHNRGVRMKTNRYDKSDNMFDNSDNTVDESGNIADKPGHISKPVGNVTKPDARYIIVKMGNEFKFDGYDSNNITIPIPYLTEDVNNLNEKITIISNNTDFEYKWKEEDNWAIGYSVVTTNNKVNITFNFNETEGKKREENQFIFSGSGVSSLYDTSNIRTDADTNTLYIKSISEDNSSEIIMGQITIKRKPNLLFTLGHMVSGYHQIISDANDDDGIPFNEIGVVNNTPEISISGVTFDLKVLHLTNPGNRRTYPLAFTGDTVDIKFNITADPKLNGKVTYSLAGYYYLTDGTNKITIRDGNMVYPITVKSNYSDNSKIIVVSGGKEISLNVKNLVIKQETVATELNLGDAVEYIIKCKIVDDTELISDLSIIYGKDNVLNDECNMMKFTPVFSPFSTTYVDKMLHFNMSFNNNENDRRLYIVSNIGNVSERLDEINSNSPEVVHTIELGDESTKWVFIEKLIRPEGENGFIFLIKEGSEE